MIFKFRMISGDEKAFLRDFDIDSNQTFFDFHNIIQKNLCYDPAQLASFFLTDENWNKGLELTLIDMENDAGPAAIPMDSVKIKEIIKEKKERLLYVYDIFTDNSFFLELFDIYTPDCSIKYPICSASIGEPPLQLGIHIDSLIPLIDENPIDEFFKEYDPDELDSSYKGIDGDDE